MSTFDGVIRECPPVRIDLFTDTSEDVHVYFLSHAHSDHMRGMESLSFYHHVVDTKVKLYCSPITKILLDSLPQYSRIAKRFKTLPVGEPYELSIPMKEGQSGWLTVTLIPAGHCPGSVMFFMEGRDWKALYTGDFRLDIGSASKIPWFHYGKSVKTINTVYVDTTFIAPEVTYLSSRPESNKEILSQMKNHLSQGNDHIIFIKAGARFGYENVYRQIYQEFGHKVCISDSMYACYSRIPDILETVTLDRTTPIYSGYSLKKMRLSPTLNIKVLHLSTMFFILHKVPTVRCYIRKSNTVRICYSFHSSMEEVLDFLLYLSPGQIEPNVKPLGMSLDETRDLLNGMLQQAKNDPTSCPSRPELPQWKSFGKIKDRTADGKQNSEECTVQAELLHSATQASNGKVASQEVYESSQSQTICTHVTSASSDQMLLFSDSDVCESSSGCTSYHSHPGSCSPDRMLLCDEESGVPLHDVPNAPVKRPLYEERAPESKLLSVSSPGYTYTSSHKSIVEDQDNPSGKEKYLKYQSYTAEHPHAILATCGQSKKQVSILRNQSLAEQHNRVLANPIPRPGHVLPPNERKSSGTHIDSINCPIPQSDAIEPIIIISDDETTGSQNRPTPANNVIVISDDDNATSQNLPNSLEDSYCSQSSDDKRLLFSDN